MHRVVANGIHPLSCSSSSAPNVYNGQVCPIFMDRGKSTNVGPHTFKRLNQANKLLNKITSFPLPLATYLLMTKYNIMIRVHSCFPVATEVTDNPRESGLCASAWP